MTCRISPRHRRPHAYHPEPAPDRTLIVFSVLSGLWWALYHVTGAPMLGAVIFPWLYAAVVFETYRLNLEKREKDK